MTTPRRLAPLVAVGALVLALAGCTPSGFELEQRVAKSAYRVHYDREASGAVDCSLELAAELSTGDRYDGTCTVQGATFPMAALYREVSPGQWRASAVAEMPGPRTHICTFEKSGGEPWRRVTDCTTGPGSIP